MMRKTKIICTLGPACDNEKTIRSLLKTGMDVARFNFSHGDYEEHTRRQKLIRKLSKEEGLYIPCILDTKGPEIRTGTFKDGSVTLKEGQIFTLTTDEIDGDDSRVTISFKGLPEDVHEGDKILVDDGLIAMSVIKTTASEITCKVINGGGLGDRKGINVPGVTVSLPYMSEKDRNDIVFGVENGFEFIAASFTRNAQDLLDIRKVLEDLGGGNIGIIAKIENMEGVKNIDAILRLSRGIMVARGDMGVEIPLEDVPIIQKRLINKAYRAGKIVITATQMLDSMIYNPRPTRAETTDVANAIYDGTSAIMLSGETAAGKYPVEAVETMARIALRAENDINYERKMEQEELPECTDVTNAISHAACTTAYDLGAAAIIAVTKTGMSVRNVSKYRPSIPIIGCSPDNMTLRQLNMSWGVTPLAMQEESETDKLFSAAVENSKAKGLLENGDLAVITAGVPLGVAGTTNMLKVHIVGDVLVKGNGINDMCAQANLCVAATEEDARNNFQDGDILVIHKTSNNILDLMKRSSGIVTEEEGDESHAAIAGIALDKPVIVGAVGATQILKSGTMVKLDGEKGLVCIIKGI